MWSCTYTVFWYAAFLKMVLQVQQYQTKINTYYTNYDEFAFNRFKKVLDSVGQSEYHNTTQYASKIDVNNSFTVCYDTIQII